MGYGDSFFRTTPILNNYPTPNYITFSTQNGLLDTQHNRCPWNFFEMLATMQFLNYTFL